MQRLHFLRCGKPLTATLDDATALEKLARDRGRFVGESCTCSGYPLKWMPTAIGQKGNAQAAWRTEEHGFTGGYTIMKDGGRQPATSSRAGPTMRERERQGREMFVPVA